MVMFVVIVMEITIITEDKVTVTFAHTAKRRGRTRSTFILNVKIRVISGVLHNNGSGERLERILHLC